MSSPASKTAAANGGRDLRISNWRPHNKNTLKAFFTAILPSGMVLHNLMLHEKGEARWIGFPAKEYTDPRGQRQFARFVEFNSRAAADWFRDQVLAALDKYLARSRP